MFLEELFIENLLMTVMLVFVLEFVESFVFCWGSFNNYVDKIREVGGQKNPIIVHVQALWLSGTKSL